MYKMGIEKIKADNIKADNIKEMPLENGANNVGIEREKMKHNMMLQNIGIKSNISKLNEALSFDTGRGDMPDQDMVSSALNGLYNNGKISIDEITDVIGGLPSEAKRNLVKFYEKQKTIVQKESKKTKIGNFFAKIVDVVDDAAEKVGVGKYEKEEFNDIIKVALNPESKKNSNEGKLIASIDNLVKEQNYPKLVDILQGISPMNMGDKGKIGAGILGTLTILSGGLLPILASGFLGTRWLRQNKIKKIAQDPHNAIILKGIKSEITIRLKNANISNGQKDRLKEVMEVLES